MADKMFYYIEPNPTVDELLRIHSYIKELGGYKLSYTTESTGGMEMAKKLILEKGSTKILSSQILTEEVLPDSTSRDVLSDTLVYKLKQINPTSSLTIIDSYLFPRTADAGYEDFLFLIFQSIFQQIQSLSILTQANRNVDLENTIIQRIKSINSQLLITQKYSEDFHDRFWIADEAKGLFIGTSLNGIGRRYALIDNIADRDTKEILSRFNRTP